MVNKRLPEGPFWTKNWIQQIWEFTNRNFVDFDTGEVDFEKLGREEYEFRKALAFKNFKNSDRAKQAFYESVEVYNAHKQSGQSGGRPPFKEIPPPKDKQEFYDFVAEKNLHEKLAQDWYALNEERKWKDKRGNPIKNWKGALIGYIRQELKKESANENQD